MTRRAAGLYFGGSCPSRTGSGSGFLGEGAGLEEDGDVELEAVIGLDVGVEVGDR